MAQEGELNHIPGLVAGEAFTSKQFYFCYLSAANTVVGATATGQKCLGIIQDKAASGDATDIAVCGRSKVVLSSVATYGNTLVASANGTACTASATATHYGMAIALESGVSGDIIACALGAVPPLTGVS